MITIQVDRASWRQVAAQGLDPPQEHERDFLIWFSSWQRSRGGLYLGKKASRMRHLCVVNPASKVVFATRIVCLRELANTPTNTRRTLVELEALPPEDPVCRRWLGRVLPMARNPVRYHWDEDNRASCRCGCGGTASAGALFLPGHDRRAIHQRVSQVGGAVAFMEWFDRVWGSPESGVPPE